MPKCPVCEGEIPETCPVCGETGRHNRKGGKLGELSGMTVDDWRSVYQLWQRQQQEMLALIHSIEARIRKGEATLLLRGIDQTISEIDQEITRVDKLEERVRKASKKGN